MQADIPETSRNNLACAVVRPYTDNKGIMMKPSTESPSLLLIAGLPTPSRMFGGEVEKNRQLVAELARLGVETMSCNVLDWRHRPLAVALALVRSIRVSSQIVVSVADKGLFALALSPFSTVLARKRVCILVVGGMLDKHIIQLKPLLQARARRFVQRADIVAVETKGMVTNMRQLGCLNVMRLSNFRARDKAGKDPADKSQAGGVLRAFSCPV